MKRKIIITLALALFIVLALCVTAFAEENVPEVTHEYYIVQSLDSEIVQDLISQGISADSIITLDTHFTTTNGGTSFFDSDDFPEGSHIQYTFAESVYASVADYQGVLLNKKITVTVIYNGFTHYISDSTRENVFVLRHPDAKLRLIGSNGMQDKNDTSYINATISNGKITNDKTSDAEQKTNLDFRHGKVYAWVFDGDVYCENIRSFTGEEAVYTCDGTDKSADEYEFVNCVLNGYKNVIALEGKNYRKIIKIDGGYYSKMLCYTISNGSYIKNAIVGSYTMDCWEDINQVLVLQNTKIDAISTATGRTDFLMIDCEFSISNVTGFGSDTGGKTVFVLVTSADCENAPQVDVYVGSATAKYTYDYYVANVTSLEGKSDSKAIDVEVEEAKGHTKAGKATALEYTDGFNAKGYYCYDCSVCEKNYSEQTAKPIFTAKGYSYKLDTTNGHGIAGGYEVNHTALNEYQEFTGKVVEFGVVMFNVNSEQAQVSEKLFENGLITLTQNAIQVSATSSIYSTITFKINGFKGEALNYELAIALYVNEITLGEGDAKSYSTTFVQSEVTEDDRNATSGTYEKGGVNLSTVTCYSVSGTAPQA